MSMFCRPGDSSSSSESSNDQTEDDESIVPQQDSVLSRINTLDSAVSGRPSVRPNPPLPDIRQTSAQNVRDLLLHSLLEKEALTHAAEELGKDRSDPDVQKLGRELYREMARQISNNVDDTYASDEMRAHRATAQEGITRLTRSNLNKLSATARQSSQELISFAQNRVAMNSPLPLSELSFLSTMSIPSELNLHGYPGLQTDRYLREFVELGMVGKGGYGKVFKAKHNLDGSLYAVKRIPISPAKMAKIQQNGFQELESMLDEVRSLARFDHANVVRYHNAWLEFATENITNVASNQFRDDRLLEGVAKLSVHPSDASKVSSGLNNIVFEDSHDKADTGASVDIVFGITDSGLDAEESKFDAESTSTKDILKQFRRRNRRGSQATMATISSTKSRMSAVEDVDEDDDEEVEVIPRTHMPSSQETHTEFSENMVSHSDLPAHLVQSAPSGPMLMLNVQMNLCETNLAAFISTEGGSSALERVEKHCFHPCFSMELLNNIASGVQYLHAQGVVHRDLKPANVFLSLSSARHAPYGSVDMSSCGICPKRDCLHVTPRIGDFGLVAVLDNTCGDFKPVGTEFYRPQICTRINDKLDMYALGIIGFEVLQPFGTRMERIVSLNELRCGNFPAGFLDGVENLSGKVQDLICSMIHMDEEKRLNCDEVKAEVGRLLHLLRM